MGKHSGKRFANTVYVHSENGDDVVLMRGEDAGDYDSALVDDVLEGNPDIFVDESESLEVDTASLKVAEVEQWVGTDPERARVAIENEYQREGGPRAGMVRRLEKIAEANVPTE